MKDDASPSSNPEGEDVLAWLAGGAAFGDRTPPTVIETHAAMIFLTGNRAWKLKKAVNLGYLDFSTLAQRRAALEAELCLNRRTALDLYLAVRKVVRSATGAFVLGGDGEAVEWLLEMRRFPDGALLRDQLTARALSPSVLLRLADDIVAFHHAAETVGQGSGADRVKRVADGNAARLAAQAQLFDESKARFVTATIAKNIADHRDLLDERARNGRVRLGHGDLHLANIAMIDGKAVPFDCLEFDRELATGDVLYDLAFLLMDLWANGLRDEANLVFNRYLDLSEVDEAGIALIPLFMSIRATVRAHVAATLASQGEHDKAAREAGRYLDVAAELLEKVPPSLIAIGGLSGSGKSTVARAIASRIGRAPGARILRSDVLRKRSAGLAPEIPLPIGAYAKEASERVYQQLDALAATDLNAGQAAIADAMFGTLIEKTDIRGVASDCGCAFYGFWLDLDEATRVARISGRSRDASDATAEVTRLQSSDKKLAADDWSRVSAAMTPSSIQQEILTALV